MGFLNDSRSLGCAEQHDTMVVSLLRFYIFASCSLLHRRPFPFPLCIDEGDSFTTSTYIRFYLAQSFTASEHLYRLVFPCLKGFLNRGTFMHGLPVNTGDPA